MTNTLHRYGGRESFRDDYVVFAIPAKGINDEDSVPKLKEFLKICIRHNPINIGNGIRNSLSPEKGLNPTVHWKRPVRNDWEAVIDGITKPGTVSAVFATMEDASACLKDIVNADFGLSVNISTSIDGAKEIAECCKLKRHSIEYALEFSDPHNKLPDARVLELSTMCGHGMVSFNLSKKMIDMVREGRRSVEDAASTLVRFCPCGVYNAERAKRILNEIIRKK